MLARKGTFPHPLGGLSIDTPRLIPSFSSKGFQFEGKGGKILSLVDTHLKLMSPYIKESLLISAYDIHHRHFAKPLHACQNKEIVFIDSGGYELASVFDATEPKKYHCYTPLRFSQRDYEKVLAALPKNIPFIISNYDWASRGNSIEAQIQTAQRFFTPYPKFLHNFLMKPAKKDRFIDIDEVIRHAGKLNAFNVVGLTEDEVAFNLIDKLKGIAKLRAALDRANVKAPIHIWGGLDPILTPLYFFAGAEIFDGVSWMRYAFHNGIAASIHSCSVLDPKMGIETPAVHSEMICLNHNLMALQQLSTSFRRFVDGRGNDFSMFDQNAVVLEKAYKTMTERIPELNGGENGR